LAVLGGPMLSAPPRRGKAKPAIKSRLVRLPAMQIPFLTPIEA
jgi:hypothetical protein